MLFVDSSALLGKHLRHPKCHLHRLSVPDTTFSLVEKENVCIPRLPRNVCRN